jgi:hypothetical protein
LAIPPEEPRRCRVLKLPHRKSVRRNSVLDRLLSRGGGIEPATNIRNGRQRATVALHPARILAGVQRAISAGRRLPQRECRSVGQRRRRTALLEIDMNVIGTAGTGSEYGGRNRGVWPGERPGLRAGAQHILDAWRAIETTLSIGRGSTRRGVSVCCGLVEVWG